jgi:hypothetical protein
MALANRRPVTFPVTETATSSPSFKPRRLSLVNDYSINSKKDARVKDELNSIASSNQDIRETTPSKSSTSSPGGMQMDGSPTSVSTSLTSLSSNSSQPEKKYKEGKTKGEKKEKKEKQSSRVPTATGISTTIPVTGERPKPEEDKSLDDGVLYAIFEILYERDEEGQGMTVKQICDILVEKHPEMAKLSTKTSNLVSAKLNAYVKRVEKGEKSLVYALSREWADASPKRMVYVYRGLLAPDYYIHALAAIEKQKLNGEEGTPATSDLLGAGDDSLVSAEEKKKFFDSLKDEDQFSSSDHQLKRRATAFDLGINRNTFIDLQLDLVTPQILIPYSAAPVTASLGLGSVSKHAPFKSNQNVSDYEMEDYDSFNDDEDDLGNEIKITYRNSKRSKSMSYLSSKKARTLTIAAAAPRLSTSQATPSPSAAAAAAALHAAALEGLSPAGSVASGFDGSTRESFSSGPPVAAKWLKAVKDGFLTQDIGAPEDITLAELDSLFT